MGEALDSVLPLPPTAVAVPQGRRHVLRALQGWGLEHLCETAGLLTSELLTNAVLHARTPLELRVVRAGGVVVVSVRDGSTVVPVERAGSGAGTTGRGLGLLTELARSWDVEVDDAGKTVRFLLDGSAGAPDPWARYRDAVWSDL